MKPYLCLEHILSEDSNKTVVMTGAETAQRQADRRKEVARKKEEVAREKEALLHPPKGKGSVGSPTARVHGSKPRPPTSKTQAERHKIAIQRFYADKRAAAAKKKEAEQAEQDTLDPRDYLKGSPPIGARHLGIWNPGKK